MRKVVLALVAIGAAPAALTVAPARADVYVTPAAPVYVYPRPFRPWRSCAPVHYAPAPVAVAHACTTRVVRVWVDGRHVSRPRAGTRSPPPAAEAGPRPSGPPRIRAAD